MADFTMPSLGADMDAGTLLEWRVKPGEAVKRGDIVAVVDTSKAEIEVEIFEDGVIGELLVEEGTKVPVGTPLATVRAAGGEGAPEPPPAAEPPPADAPPPAEPPPPAPAPPREDGAGERRPRVSPLARRSAERLGDVLAAIPGSG
ncbi:MAG: biotin/lipoyl-containing protein, partial [Solirubrobacterales bacterium]